MDCLEFMSMSFRLHFQFQKIDRICAANGFIGGLTADCLWRHATPPTHPIGNIVVRVVDRKDDSIDANLIDNMLQEFSVVVAPVLLAVRLSEITML